MKSTFNKAVIISIILITSVACKTKSSYTKYPLAFYEVEAKGSTPQLKVRMISDYSFVVPKQLFKIGFFFKLKKDWYTYSTDQNKDYIPTELVLNLPEGFEIIKEEWPVPTLIAGKTENEKEMIYNKDFKVVFIIKAAEKLSINEKVTANVSWQVCKSSLCILGAAQLSYRYYLPHGPVYL